LFLLANPTATVAAVDKTDGAPPSPTSALDRERVDLHAAIVKLQGEDGRGAAATFGAVLASPSFSDLTDAERHSALFLYGYLLLAAGDAAQAHALLVKSTAMDEAVGLDWHVRLDAAARPHRRLPADPGRALMLIPCPHATI
jgi:hypothetical protein